MAKNPFVQAIETLVEEKNLPREIVIEAIEQALGAAYRKEYGRPGQIIKTKLNPETGDFDPFQIFEIVEKEEDIENKESQLTLAQAKLKDKKATLDGEITLVLPHKLNFGRIAAQTAKQVILQRIREAERNLIYQTFKEKEGQLVTGTVQNIEGKAVIVNVNQTSAVMPPSEQIQGEHYYIGQRLRTYVKSVEESNRGPRIIVSRANPDLIKGLFMLEVPEILAGAVEIKGIAREPGSRTKVAVHAIQENLDPIGSAVGQRGSRINSILSEIGEEKIDIVLWSDNLEQFITNALSPAKIERVKINNKNQTAKVYVAQDMMSLAIGRGGQNVRLAGKLVDLTLDIEKLPGEEDELGKTGKTSKKKRAQVNTNKLEQKLDKTSKTGKVKQTPNKSKQTAQKDESKEPIKSKKSKKKKIQDKTKTQSNTKSESKIGIQKPPDVPSDNPTQPQR